MSPQMLDDLRSRFNFDQWAQPATDSRVFFWRLQLTGRELTDWQPHRIQVRELPGDCRLINSIWKPREGESTKLLRLDVYENPSQKAARERLLEILGNFQAPNIQKQEALLTDEVAFGPPGGGSRASTWANLVLVLANAGREVQPVRPLAEQLANGLLARPPASSGKLLPTLRWTIDARRSHAQASTLPVEVTVDDPLDKPWWLRIDTQLGEVMLQEGKLVYQAARAGAEEFQVVAVTADGRVTERSWTIKFK